METQSEVVSRFQLLIVLLPLLFLTGNQGTIHIISYICTYVTTVQSALQVQLHTLSIQNPKYMELIHLADCKYSYFDDYVSDIRTYVHITQACMLSFFTDVSECDSTSDLENSGYFDRAYDGKKDSILICCTLL